jgi:hypothetical protein
VISGPVTVPPDLDLQTVLTISVLLHAANGTRSLDAKVYADGIVRCANAGWVEVSGTLSGASVALTPAGIRFLHTIGVTTT